MVDTDPVRVTVEIADQFSDDIERMRRQLKSLERKLSVSLDIDDNGDINWAKASIESIEDIIDVLVKVKDGDVDKLIAKLEAVDGKDTESTHTVKEKKRKGWNPMSGGWFKGSGDDWTENWAKNLMGHMDAEGIAGKAKVPEVQLGSERDSGALGDIFKQAGRGAGLGSNERGTPFGSILKRLRPSMHKWFQILAAIMPMMVALVGAAMGLVAALGAVAIAGAVAFQLGSWGLDDAQARLEEFRRELKGVFEPASATFAPVLMEFLQRAPGILERSGLVQALTKLTAFEGLFYDIFGGASNWLAKAMSSMADFEPVIDTILSTVGNAVGGSLLNLMQWLVLETARNRDMFMRLGKVFGDIIATIYNLSKGIAFVIAYFEPLFAIVAKISDLVGNRFVMAIATALMGITMLAKAISFLATVSLTGFVGSIAKSIGMLYGYVSAAWAAVGVTSTLVTLLSMLGIGLITAGIGFTAAEMMKPDTSMPKAGTAGGMAAGLGAGGGGGGGGSPTMNVTIEGDAGRDELNRMNDMMDRKWKTYSGREESRSK